MEELKEKENRIQAFMEEKGLEALLLRRLSNFAWCTGGAASFVNTASETGVASLLITKEARYVITNNIEAMRLSEEEGLKRQGWEFVVGNWWEPGEAVVEFAAGLKLGADVSWPGAVDVREDFARLRYVLLPEEMERFRQVGHICGQAVQAAARRAKPGMSEYQIAAILAEEAMARGCQPIVNLTATDERIFSYRHPIPTSKVMERYAMLVLCARRWGLVASATRFVHFGPLYEEVARKHVAVATVDATAIAHTRPGTRVAEIFRRIQEAYAKANYPGEWQLHHQGGLAGYEPREYIATPNSQETIQAGQAFAWNPSITGTKSEDTILVGQEGNEIITAVGEWPTLSIEIEGQIIERPAILQIT